MNGRDIVARFRAATWRTTEEAEAFAAEAAEVTVPEVLKLLEVVQAKPSPAEAGLYRLRVHAFQRVAERVPDKTLFVPYVRALRGGDGTLRTALAHLLPKANNVSEHLGLVALLRSPDAALRQCVAGVLPSVGGKTVFDAMGEMLRESGFVGRSEAMDALLAIAPQHAAPALTGVLEVGTPGEKVKALGHLTEPRCIGRDPAPTLKAVAAALHDPNESVVAAAIGGVAALGAEEEYFRMVASFFDSKSLAIVRACVDGLRHFASPRAVGALHRKLRAGPNAVRLAVLDALEAIGTADVLAPLVDGLGHTQLAVRTRAGEVLSRLSAAGKLDLARTVIWLLRSRDVNVRRMAVELVQTVRDPDGELWPKLLGHLRDEDWWVRERVMDALVGMAGEPLVRHLVGFLNDPSEIVRRFGVDALLRLKSPQSLGALVRTAGSDPDWWVRERAIEAVGAIGDQRAAPHLVDIMIRNPPLQLVCLDALAAMKARSAVQRITGLLGSEDSDIQLAALRCLGAIDDPSVGSSLATIVRHPRASLRALARELVERWGQAASPEIVVDQPIPFLDQLLIAVAGAEGDDLIVAPGRRPLMKRMGGVTPIGAMPLTAEKVQGLVVPHLTGRQLMDLEAGREVDFSYRVESENLRFRVNVFQQLGGMAAVFRLIRASLPDIDKLGLPPVVRGLAEMPHGLVLVGGPTGSGKSTTLAALIDHINRTSRRHIVTLEDPIEAVHPRRESLVNQREVGTHTGSFANALRATLRQDPDVILVGEMRDLPTISFAVTAAETGHLVFGTIHTVSAAGTIDRLIGAFPASQQDHVRSLIAGSLRAVVCQFLMPRADGPGRVLALEVMLNSDAIANLIRKAKAFQIPSIIATSREQGMQLMDTELMRLLKEGKIRGEDAYSKALSKKDFEAFAADAGQGGSGGPNPPPAPPSRGAGAPTPPRGSLPRPS